MSSASALIQLLRLNTRQQIDGEDGGEGTLAKPNTHLLMFLAQHQQYRGCYYFTASKSQFGTFSRIGNIRRCFQNLFSGSEMSPRDGLFGFQVGECFGIRAPLSSVKCSSLTLDQKSPLTHQKHQKKPPRLGLSLQMSKRWRVEPDGVWIPFQQQLMEDGPVWPRPSIPRISGLRP